MNITITRASEVRLSGEPSKAAQQRLLSRWGEPFFVAGWNRVLMIHFEVDREALQREVPFQLDLLNGRAFVSAVAFTMIGMRPCHGGRFAEWLFRPLATHDFLNVRTYVRYRGESGIHFLAEWLSSRLAVKFGPAAFGLPDRYGRIAYQHDAPNEIIRGQVVDAASDSKLEYRARYRGTPEAQPCEAGSTGEWLMERYTAFNSAGLVKRLFRVWHPPWPQWAAAVTLEDTSLLRLHWPWFKHASLLAANFSPGFNEVWMGRPHLAKLMPFLP
jgi:uncharacterized protein YqjF (DUF2071 family)